VIEIFAYGTLRDREYQQALFDRTLPMRSATLAGWLAVVAESGYLTLVRAPGETVAGDLLTVDDDALALADAWEEVPLYERLRAEARAADGSPVAAWVYVRPSDSRERAPRDMLARHEHKAVLAQIRRFRAAYATRRG
jgi:gamma-glutamylcyclotransferase (GGCT)/AIG2-like uncharacterized protein YtfP